MEIQNNFWQSLPRPILGLSPMDGVTDTAFRNMFVRHGKPSILVTEFTNVEGLARGARKMMIAFKYTEAERPIIGQIYGVEVDSFYKATVMLCALGFDGVDINMGCPANKVAKKGSGAGLIKTPELAREIIRICKKGAEDWMNGITMEDAGVHSEIIDEVKNMNLERTGAEDLGERRLVPISVKTRVGYDKEIVEEWMKELLVERPAAIMLHGRTLKQMYLGKADWEAIGRAREVVKKELPDTAFLGNGDIESLEDAIEKTSYYKLDGVLVGRATFGNPWFFSGKEEISLSDRLGAVVEHCDIFAGLLPELPFHHIKKHLAWYCKGFEGAREMRMGLMKCENAEEVRNLLSINKNG